MCDKYCNCDNCGYDKSKCEYLGDGSPFCGMFQCTVKDCKRFNCISLEEEQEVYGGGCL